MPRIVDHAQRRASIARAACEAIARDGLEGATLARVAREAGVTTGAIQHYFQDKDGVLEAALEHTYQDQLARMARRAGNTPYCLVQVLAEALPASPASRRTMRVWLAFWGRAMGDARIARAQRQIHQHWAARVSEEIARAAHQGELGRDLELDLETESLIAQIRGICIRALLDPGAWPRNRQIAMLEHHLAGLRTGDRPATDTSGVAAAS